MIGTFPRRASSGSWSAKAKLLAEPGNDLVFEHIFVVS
jgi:hypothetical protein